ncbi:hypothetical protein ApDm4_0025 [Acetobacter pomorum]|nr:hypothetical protein ApDm4_0025 [Acetobacter pomorum]
MAKFFPLIQHRTRLSQSSKPSDVGACSMLPVYTDTKAQKA